MYSGGFYYVTEVLPLTKIGRPKRIKSIHSNMKFKVQNILYKSDLLSLSIRTHKVGEVDVQNLVLYY